METISERVKGRLITLCHRCLSDYQTAGYRISRADWQQGQKDTCDLCNHGRGYDYYIVEIRSRIIE